MSDTIEFSIPMDNDEEGFFGRECPSEDCLGYFKIELGTGLQGDNLPCHCPYCGHTADHDHFWTQDQLAYAESLATRKVQELVDGMLKDAFPTRHPRRGEFISLTWEVKPGRRIPLHHYQEKQLETALVCDKCGLRYAVYGVFAFCPDCGSHNSLQILEANLDLAAKELELAALVQGPLSAQLVSDALENAVSAFDAFGRELFRVNADIATDPVKAAVISCQNLAGLKKRVAALFEFDLSASFRENEWCDLERAFQKRHLIAHKMGVVDEAYMAATSDSHARVGRKIALDAPEVSAVLPLVRRLGESALDLLRVKRDGATA